MRRMFIVLTEIVIIHFEEPLILNIVSARRWWIVTYFEPACLVWSSQLRCRERISISQPLVLREKLSKHNGARMTQGAEVMAPSVLLLYLSKECFRWNDGAIKFEQSRRICYTSEDLYSCCRRLTIMRQCAQSRTWTVGFLVYQTPLCLPALLWRVCAGTHTRMYSWWRSRRLGVPNTATIPDHTNGDTLSI